MTVGCCLDTWRVAWLLLGALLCAVHADSPLQAGMPQQAAHSKSGREDTSLVNNRSRAWPSKTYLYKYPQDNLVLIENIKEKKVGRRKSPAVRWNGAYLYNNDVNNSFDISEAHLYDNFVNIVKPINARNSKRSWLNEKYGLGRKHVHLKNEAAHSDSSILIDGKIKFINDDKPDDHKTKRSIDGSVYSPYDFDRQHNNSLVSIKTLTGTNLSITTDPLEYGSGLSMDQPKQTASGQFASGKTASGLLAPCLIRVKHDDTDHCDTKSKYPPVDPGTKTLLLGVLMTQLGTLRERLGLKIPGAVSYAVHTVNEKKILPNGYVLQFQVTRHLKMTSLTAGNKCDYISRICVQCFNCIYHFVGKILKVLHFIIQCVVR